MRMAVGPDEFARHNRPCREHRQSLQRPTDPAGQSLYQGCSCCRTPQVRPTLMDRIFGSRKWMAAQLGSTHGKAKSGAKAGSSRLKGMKGGRP